MSKLKQYQAELQNATQQALRDMSERSQTNFHEHGLNQNGDKMREVTNDLNESQRVVEEAKGPSLMDQLKANVSHFFNYENGMQDIKRFGMKGWDEIGHATRAFHDPDTIPVSPSYLEANTNSPLQTLQQQIYVPEQEQEMSR